MKQRLWMCGVMIFFLVTARGAGQAYHLRVQVRAGSPAAGYCEADLQIRSAAGPFRAGSGNLVLRYNAEAVSAPQIVGSMPAGEYYPLSIAMPFGPGSLSLNIERKDPAGEGLAVTGRFQTIVTLRFRMADPNRPPAFRWQSADAGPVATVFFAADEQHMLTLTAADVQNATAGEQEPNLPENFQLLPNYPNPFNPATQIRFQLPATDQRVQLLVFNSLGAKVRTLVDDHLIAGVYELRWDAINDRGEAVASGIYFVQLRAGSFRQTRRMVLLR